jgi:lysophospholipase L1-like esterase
MNANISLLARSTLICITLLSAPMAIAEPLRVLTYGDSNTWGWNPLEKGYPATRFSDQQRWSGILDKALGEDVKVIVDGMVGRTTDIDSKNAVGPVAATDFNGRASLAVSIAKHSPLDLVVIMLGTNDLQMGRERPPMLVAKAAFDLADLAKSVKQPIFSSYPAPKVLVIAPAALGDTSKTPLNSLFGVAEKPSTQLSSAFTTEAKSRDIPFFDASLVVETQGVDGIHFNLENHNQLGKALASKITKLLNK